VASQGGNVLKAEVARRIFHYRIRY
jgi:hypothetical protein